MQFFQNLNEGQPIIVCYILYFHCKENSIISLYGYGHVCVLGNEHNFALLFSFIMFNDRTFITRVGKHDDKSNIISIMMTLFFPASELWVFSAKKLLPFIIIMKKCISVDMLLHHDCFII